MKPLRLLLAWACLLAWAASLERYRLDGVPLPCLRVDEARDARSKILCAALCNMRDCRAFVYRDPACYLFNFGEKMDGASFGYYHLANDTINMAFCKEVSAPAHYSFNVVNRSVDGYIGTHYHSIGGVTHPYWTVDLGLPCQIQLVRVFPNYEYDVHYERFLDIEVSVGMEPPASWDAPGFTFLGYYVGPYDNTSCCSVDFIPGSRVEGQYVHIKRATVTGADFIIVKEVLVYV